MLDPTTWLQERSCEMVSVHVVSTTHSYKCLSQEAGSMNNRSRHLRVSRCGNPSKMAALLMPIWNQTMAYRDHVSICVHSMATELAHKDPTERVERRVRETGESERKFPTHSVDG